MARRAGCRTIATLILAALPVACGLLPGREPRGALSLSFEDRAEPGVFSAEGAGRRDAPEGAGGLWAVVEGLGRPERGRVENLATGAAVTVALFAGGSANGEIRLSGEAADALGIADEPVRVRVTALRREPLLTPDHDAF
jgi:hypothetical protein